MAETRKLAAIVVFDMVGYSRLAGADEERMRALRSDLIDPTVAERVEAFTNVDLSNRARGAHVSHDSHATTNNHSNEVHVGQVNIHTPATDAPGLAGTIGPAIEQSFLTTQANYGLA